MMLNCGDQLHYNRSLDNFGVGNLVISGAGHYLVARPSLTGKRAQRQMQTPDFSMSVMQVTRNEHPYP